jgi:competence protein ComEA
MRHTLRMMFVAWLAIGCASERAAPPVPFLDLNAATEKEMEALPGIGPERARSIMASRNARGGRFRRLDDLLEIKGIGPETVDKIRPYVVLGPGK